MLTLGNGCSVEPEVDLAGHWLDGDVLHIGADQGRRRGPRRHAKHARARCCRSDATPRSRPGRRSSARSPTGSSGRAPRPSPSAARAGLVGERPRHSTRWVARVRRHRRSLIALLPSLAAVVGARRRPCPWLLDATSLGDAALVLLRLAAGRRRGRARRCWPLLVAGARRGCSGSGSSPGAYPIHSRRAWQAWATMRLLDEARTWLFPLYSSTLTPVWLRLLGARIGVTSRPPRCC